MTQTALILAHLNRGGTLTALQALRLFNTLRLAARIKEIRECGVKVQSRRVRLSGNKWVAVYYL